MEKDSEIKSVERVKAQHIHTEMSQAGMDGAVDKSHHHQENVFVRAGHFFLHFLEMCVIMCASLGIFTLLIRGGTSLIGFSNPIRQYPEPFTVALAIYFALVMIGWMRLRGHEWRPTLEMASTSILALIPVISAGRLGAVAQVKLLGLECGVACVLMLIPMLLRLDHYTKSHASHQH